MPGAGAGSARRVEILPAKRRALILDYLKVNGASSIQELSDAIGGSLSTVRRDLDQLVERGYLERTHGGAMLPPQQGATFEGEPSVNAELRHAEKAAIGREAARRLSPGDSVIFESSSTVMEAVRAAADRDLPLTVVTNSLQIAQFGAGIPRWRIIMPGGTLRPGSHALAGEPGESFFREVHADLCVTSAWAVSGTILTDASFEVAAMKRAMIASARRTLLLVDSAKFQRLPAFCTFCETSAIDEIITDDGLRPEDREGLVAQGTRFTVADVPRG